MKKFVWVLLICLLFTACDPSTDYKGMVAELTGLNITGSTIISQTDSHGGFLGDGELCVVFDCSKIADSVAQQTKSWRRCPLSENLQLVRPYTEKYGIPEISNGCYYFVNRQASKDKAHDDAALIGSASCNFSLFLYDEDTCKLYYYELDT